jgi:glucokinase
VLDGLWRGAVDVAVGPEGIRRQITTAVLELLAKENIDRARLKGVGIGFGGPVDDATRTVIKSHQIEGWDDFPLADWVSELVGLPAALGNDADVAGLAEALFGAGKGLSPVFYITLGSGIGGGFIINGEIYRGAGRGAAEIGHLKVTCAVFRNLPASGTLQDFASGWAIGRAPEMYYRYLPPTDPPLFIPARDEQHSLTVQDVSRAADEGNILACRILVGAWESLAEAICHVIALLCPRRIVIGGGVSLIGEKLLFEPLRRMVAEHVFPPFAGCYDIVPAALGEAVVVHGALALARRQCSDQLREGRGQ